MGVNKGKWYYEVHLKSNGLFQIGWTYNLEFGGNSGVGDDEMSFAFDGSRVKKWNGTDEDYGHTWSSGNKSNGHIFKKKGMLWECFLIWIVKK